MKNFVYVFILLIVVTKLFFFVFDDSENSVDSSTIIKEEDEFILRVHMEQKDEGVEVKHSLQYVGPGEVNIFHRTPLVSISFGRDSHYFTGSYVEKSLKQNEIYYQDDMLYPAKSKEEYEVYIQAEFYQDEEEIYIDHLEKIEVK